jgi:pyruvate formate lyase activating enzyme
VRPALLWKALGQGRAQCRLCSHFCVVPEGGRGQCGVRLNQGGELFTLAAERVAAVNVDPVEKKPLYHFLPGSRTFSFATMGCNLSCSFCQNYALSQPPRQNGRVAGEPATPESLVDAALRNDCRSVSYTYSEPTVFFELMLPTARLARERGLANILVSNGFQSPECLEELGPYIDAANIDLKAFSEEFYRERCGARLAPVLDNLRRMAALGWWLEITTLVIPGLNDSDPELAAVAGFIARELSPQTPWHVSRFHPDFTLTDRGPTPVSTLERALAAGRRAGLQFVYVGNAPGHDGENTRCPACGQVVLERMGFAVTERHLRGASCGHCGATIPGVWE